MQARKPTVDLAALESEERRICKAPSGNSEEARCRLWNIVGVRVGLPRHDTEVESVVVKDDAVLVLPWPRTLCSSACPKMTMPPRVPRASQGWLLQNEKLFEF